jgi:hypothetical protein
MKVDRLDISVHTAPAAVALAQPYGPVAAVAHQDLGTGQHEVQEPS